MPGEGFVPDFADDLVDRLDDARTLDTVRAALGTLRRVEQDVFALVVWAGLDYVAAAEALGLPVGTVRSRLSRARRRLRKLLDGSGEPDRGDGQLEGDHDHAARTRR
jgi:RNA polymerase sigma-70 factor (ECF subfamily)